MSSNPPAEAHTKVSAGRGWLPRWPRSLTNRLVVGTVVLVALASVFVTVVTTLALRQFLLQRLDDQLAAVSHRTSEGGRPAVPELGPPSVSSPCLNPFEGPGGGIGTLDGVVTGDCSRVWVVTEEGSQEALGAATRRPLTELAADADPHTVDLGELGEFRVTLVEVDGNTLVTGISLKGVNATVSRLVAWEALVALIAVALAGAAASLLVRRQLRPLQEVASTARQVSVLPLDSGSVGVTARVPDRFTNPETEVGQVGEALNVLLSSVESAFEARHASEQRVRRFVADASHELRTPLSTIQGYAELSRRGGRTEAAELLRSMAKVESESHRMSVLVDDLLLLARLDSGRPLERDEVDLTRMTVEAVNDARVVAADHRWRLDVPEQPVLVTGDEQRLHQVLSNLIGNARRHTGPGTTVLVSLREPPASDLIELSVSDDGPGFPLDLEGDAFERFTRGDSSRTRQSGGAGLGLSIVKAIVAAHGGSVSASSHPGSTVVTVSLPALHSRATD